jgi:hypothetical protein
MCTKLTYGANQVMSPNEHGIESFLGTSGLAPHENLKDTSLLHGCSQSKAFVMEHRRKYYEPFIQNEAIIVNDRYLTERVQIFKRFCQMLPFHYSHQFHFKIKVVHFTKQNHSTTWLACQINVQS